MHNYAGNSSLTQVLNTLFGFEGAMPIPLFVAKVYAPLAQLVEHLTLNQGVQGSSP